MEQYTNHFSPTGWANDPLTQFLDNCRGNQWATFDNKRHEVIDLITIDGMFRKLISDAVNPKPFLPMGFLFRSHSAYLSACGAIMAGQVYESSSLLRVCLEQGGYALYVGNDQKRWEHWIARHDTRSKSQQDKWKEEFTHGKVLRHLRRADAGLGEAYAKLYDRTIDYGAHPNERGIFGSMKTEEIDDGSRRFNTVYLHGDGLHLDFALKTTAQVGISVLRIAHLIYPLRMQATGVLFQLETISKRF